MDFFEAQDFAKQMYPNQNVAYIFDQNCIRDIHFVYTDGKCNEACHCVYNKIKIVVDGEVKHTMPIKPHRQSFVADEMRQIVARAEIYKEKE